VTSQQLDSKSNRKRPTTRSYFRWLFSSRWIRKDNPQRELDAADTDAIADETVANPGQVSEPYYSEEVVRMSMSANHIEDETSTKLLNAVTRVIEDRRLLKVDLQEHKKTIELADRKIHEVETARNTAADKLLQREAELERQERRLVDNQYKFEQLQEDYQQLVATRNSEYERLQTQIREMQSKYETLSGDYSKLRRETTGQVERLEALLRVAEMHNAQLSAESEEVRKDNANLTRRITEFARQISGLGQAPSELTPVPIRPALAPSSREDERAKA